jgi:DNA-binding MarR family transcriptional regulator
MVANATIWIHIPAMTEHYRVDNFAGPQSIGFLLCQTQSVLRPQVEALFEREDISFSQWRVMMCLRDGIAATCAELSRELAHDKGSMTRLVDQLEERGLLARERDAEDRRIVFLTLTPAGHAAVNALVPKVVVYYNALLRAFSAEEVASLTHLLKRLRSALRGTDGAGMPEEGRAGS